MSGTRSASPLISDRNTHESQFDRGLLGIAQLADDRFGAWAIFGTRTTPIARRESLLVPENV